MAKKSPEAKKEKQPANSSMKTKIYNWVVLGLWGVFILVMVGIPLYFYTVSVNLWGLYGDMPSPKMLENPENDLSSELYSADNVLLGKYFRENRVNAAYDELSPNLVKALMAIEDIRFEKHSGIDMESMGRVAWGIVKYILTLGSSDLEGGGSTISQQLAKNLFAMRRDEEFKGALYGINYKLDMLFIKTKEWITAVRLEQAYTKKEILAMYLNTIDFGSNAFGIKVAAQTFFKKTPIDLDVHEAALLAGILNAPSRLSPVYHPENAIQRRNTVISQMNKYGFLTDVEADSVKQRPLDLNYSVENHNQGLAPYFRSVIKDFLHKWAREHGYNLYEDGLKIYTTIDSRMQKYAEEAVAEHMKNLQVKFEKEWGERNPWVDEGNREIKNFIEDEARKSYYYKQLVKHYGKDSANLIMKTKRKMRVFSYKGDVDTVMSPLDSIAYYKRFLHTGFMAMNPYNGAIKAWVGGIDHKHFKYDHVRQGKRQPGSTFKPFVYATAIENGYSPCYKVLDVHQTYETGGNPPTWAPSNSDGKFSGEALTLREALAKSINSVTANLMYKMKPDNVVALAKRVGIESHLDPVLALALGISDVSVFELVGAYSTFVNEGVWTEPYYITRIEDKHGNVLYQPQPKTVEALNEETAYLMLHMLKGATEIGGGTALGLDRELRQKIDIGAKTGTTQNGSDGWFMGVTPEIVAGAWVGGDSRNIRFRSWVSGSGSRTAMPIWQYFVKKVYTDPELGLTKTSFDAPKRPLSIEINCDRYERAMLGQTGSASDSAQAKNPPAINPDDLTGFK